MRKELSAIVAAAALAAAGFVMPAAAQTAERPDGAMSLELNGAAPTEGGACRLTLVAVNGTGQATSETSWQVGVFDSEGVVRSILALDFGALSAGKTRIAVFDMPGSPCDGISRIVVNDVASCILADGTAMPQLCLDGLQVSSRTSIGLDL